MAAVFVKASRRARAYVRSSTEKALKIRHDRHQERIMYKPGAERIAPAPPKRGRGKLRPRNPAPSGPHSKLYGMKDIKNLRRAK